MDPRPPTAALLMLIGAVLGIYVASRVLLGAFISRQDQPGRRAIAMWLPIAITALMAMGMDQPSTSIGIIFGTSVGSLSLVAGVVCLYRTPRSSNEDVMREPSFSGETNSAESRSKLSVAIFLLPCVAITWLIGFSGAFSWWHALVLLAEGIAIALVWNSGASTDVPVAKTERRLPILEIVLALVIAGIAGWAALRGSVAWLEQKGLSPAILGVTFISPVLLLPMIGATPTLAQRGRSRDALAAQVGVVFLNLGLLLPLAILTWYAAPAIKQALPHNDEVSQIHIDVPAVDRPETVPPQVPSTTAPTTEPATEPSTQSASTPATNISETDENLPIRRLVYPMGTWRIDTVLLMVLGIMFMPVALGKWQFGVAEGMLLVGGYVAYMLACIVSAFI